MENFEQMMERVDAMEAERVALRQEVTKKLENAESELAQLVAERIAMADAGDVEAFMKKNAEEQLKAVNVEKLRKQEQEFVYPTLNATEFRAWRAELQEFTNEQLDMKYRRIRDLLTVATMMLDEVDAICKQHDDVYARLEALTIGNTMEEADAEGVKYGRSGAWWHRVPEVLNSSLRNDANGSVMGVLNNMIERGDYV